MRHLLFIVFLFTFNSLLAQRPLFGVYERKWSAHSSLTLFPDSTFAEKYISFTCGNYASVFDDTVFKGRWEVNRDILHLHFYPTKHNSSWNVSGYAIDTILGQLIQVGIKDAPFLNYVKTKEFDKIGRQIWELNPSELISQFDSVLLDKKKDKRDKIIMELSFWMQGNKIEGFVNDRQEYKFYDLLFSKPYNTFQQIYFIGRLKYGLNNPEDTVSINFVKAGLKEISRVYKASFNEKYKSKLFEELVAEETKDDLKSFITKRLK